MIVDLSLGSAFVIPAIDHQLLNRTFGCTLLLSLAFYCLSLFVDKCAQSRRSSSGPVQTTIRSLWGLCFYVVSSAFLGHYHGEQVRPEVERSRYFPQYENVLFFLGSDCNRGDFRNIFVVTLAFHLLDMLLQVRESEYPEAVTRLLFTIVLAFCYNLGFEHYFLVLHITIGLYQALTHSLFLIALHTELRRQWVYNVCAVSHFLSWSYVFLTLLPFEYLLPTLYMKPFNALLNVFCWMWYGSCVWNSPVLQVLYHQTFHTLATDCLGGGNLAQCLLLRETKETRHLKWLRKTVEELRATQSRRSHSASTADNGSENQSARALQTLKCVMTLKRKLKRMRETKAAAAEAALMTAPPAAEGGSGRQTTTIQD